MGETKNTKTGGNVTTVTTMADTQFAMLTDSSGNMSKIAKQNLRSQVFAGVDQNLAYDNILIAYKDSDDWTRMVHLDEWPALQSAGKYALAVVVNDGGRVLMVAPTGAQLYWASENISGGGVTTTARRTALADFAGESNTKAQIAKSQCSDAAYAPGFCYQYSRVNSAGYGYKAGQWWLPSSGELNMIWAHIHQINYALSLITGAEQIPFSWHWSSTEYSAQYAWYQIFNASNGHLVGRTKSTSKGGVRPVSAYI